MLIPMIIKSRRANAQKFMVLLRTRWDTNFAPEVIICGKREQEALNPNRGIDSYLTIGVGSAFSAGKSVVGGAVDVLADPAFSAAIQQQTTSMQRELDRQRSREIEAKAYSTRMAAERRQASTSSLSSSLSSSYSASSSSKSSGSSSSSSGGNSNIGEINKNTKLSERKLKSSGTKEIRTTKSV